MKRSYSVHAVLLVVQMAIPVVLAFLDDEKAFKTEQEVPQSVAVGVSSVLSTS